ncbi:hypothetical protein [Streptomyces chrestomyceticus]|uniref:hypothetical protein n=1 Tax=Streptomyces chrestomyceticus TaxID=68185 RepID=UPI00379B495D
MAAEPSQELTEALRQLETILGAKPVSDYADGHTRWALHRTAIEHQAALPALLRAVKAERDASVASGVVGDVLEHLPPQERPIWVEALAPSVRGFSARRAHELAVLESIRGGTFMGATDPDIIESWSDWLQRRIATDVTTDQNVLRALAARGRTKRIRHLARETLC